MNPNNTNPNVLQNIQLYMEQQRKQNHNMPINPQHQTL